MTAVPLEDGQDLEFTVETDVRPEIELPDLEGIAVEVDEVKASDDDVDERLTALRERFGSLVGVERAVEDGDFVSIDLSASIGDEEIDSVTGVSYEVGSKNMLEGLDEALLGLAAGDTTTFTAPLAGGDHEGDDAECTVTVKSVKVRELPELDDDFAQLASEFDTLEELRADVTTQAEQAKKYEQGIQARDKLLEHLLETVDVPVPDGIVEAEVHQHLEGENRLEDDEHRAEVQESTRKALKAQFLLDAIAEKLEVRVEQPELIEYLVMSAQQYGMDPNEFAQAIDQQGQIPSIVQEVARRKALAAVLDKATVTDTAGDHDRPRRARPRGRGPRARPRPRRTTTRPTDDAAATPTTAARPTRRPPTRPQPRPDGRAATPGSGRHRGWGDEVVPTLSRTGKGSSVICRPSRASRTSRPIARPFSAPGCSTVVSTWSSHGRSTPSNPVTVTSCGHPQAQGLGGAHDPRGEQVGLGHHRRRPARCRHVEEEPAGVLPGLDGEVVRLHHRGLGTGE